MSQKFNKVKQLLKNVDKAQAGELIKEIKRARNDGQIDETERKSLMNSAKRLISSATATKSSGD